MEAIYYILAALIGAVLTFLYLKTIWSPNSSTARLENQLSEQTLQNSILREKLNSSEMAVADLNVQLAAKTDIIEDLKNEYFKTNAEKEILKGKLDFQKEEYLKLQEQSKIHFENLANKILEEKTQKFTLNNSQQLKHILEPFQDKINEFKKQVHEVYAKESNERFSLGEKVKELASLNQQISEDAKKLTRALKGDSKTQGNWGEMILERILEKSGLSKGREFFLEYQLKDEDNHPLQSYFSGKKMRPDAVVKYPDNRHIIIDAKVSLTYFSEITDDNNAETNQLLLYKHLNSVKNHINELSNKAYDDYQNSLDFVMMFIPNEAAYITAMQMDSNLWNYAYDKRILLLNPSNLITSLKLVSDLWKRENQNKNALEIAARGAKLYDKFVTFTEHLERIGKNIDQAKNSYEEAFKTLTTGKDNLVLQTEKMKNLGIKNKKKLPVSWYEDEENAISEEN